MEVLGLIGIVALAYWAYRAGKRTGSRKGFGVGLTRGHRGSRVRRRGRW